MPTGMVATVSEQWYINVLKSISIGVTEIDYWTNSWLPDKKQNVSRLEVYYQGDLFLAGDIVDQYKATPNEVFKKNNKRLYTIGLQPQNNIKDFLQMLDNSFRNGYGHKIGNIIFDVDSISSAVIKGLRSKGFKIPYKIKALPPQKANQPIRKIVYK